MGTRDASAAPAPSLRPVRHHPSPGFGGHPKEQPTREKRPSLAAGWGQASRNCTKVGTTRMSSSEWMDGPTKCGLSCHGQGLRHRKEVIAIHTAAGMNLKNWVLSGGTHLERATYHTTPLTRNTQQRQIPSDSRQTAGCQRQWGGGMGSEG